MEQGIGTTQNSDMAGIQNALQLSNQLMGRLISAIEFQFPTMSAYLSRLSVSYSTAGGTAIALGPGTGGAAIAYLNSIYVTTPCTASSTISSSIIGAIYDAASPSAVSSSNLMALIPSSGFQVYNIPFVNGLVVQPSSISSQVVSVYYTNQIPPGG